MTLRRTRPFGVFALIVLFTVGAVASFVSAVSLTFPGSFLELIWQLNPRAREGFDRIGFWAILLMAIVCVACIFTTIGLWLRRRWGYWCAVVMLVTNLAGDLINVISGAEPRAMVGVPIVLTILAYLARKQTRDYFNSSG